MKINIVSSILIVLSLSGCQNPSPSPEKGLLIPELLQREAVIGPAEEMGQMNDLYREIAGKIRRQPGAPEHWLSLVELFMQEARISGEHGYYYPAALRVLDEVLEKKLSDEARYRALFDKSSVLMSLHEFSKARDLALEAAGLNPYDAGIYGVLVDAHVELGQYEEAVGYADRMINIRPDIRSYSRASYLREIHGQVEGAIEAMKLAVSAGYPGMEQTEWARLTLGNLYLHYGQADSAEYHYRTALEMRPNYPFAMAALARIEALKGNEAGAEKMYKQAIGLIPEVGFYIELAKLYHGREDRHGQHEQMTQDILAMLADDEKAGHHMDLEYADVYLTLLDNPDKALAYAKKACSARPGNIEVNKKLAQVYFQKGDWQQARQHLRAAMKTGSQDPELACLDGLLKSEAGQKEAGLAMVRKALAVNPNCAPCAETTVKNIGI